MPIRILNIIVIGRLDKLSTFFFNPFKIKLIIANLYILYIKAPYYMLNFIQLKLMY